MCRSVFARSIWAILLCGSFLCMTACGENHAATEATDFDYAALNAQAAKEYLVSVRPGGENGRPYWNIYAKKFIYAPVFGFEEVPGAAKYRYYIWQDENHEWIFDAPTPHESLARVWDEMPVAKTVLTIQALDERDQVIKEYETKAFFRDYPFEGPYLPKARSYREAGLKGLYFIHELPSTRYWLSHDEPDQSFDLNAYFCKNIGGMVRVECLLARELPELRKEALTIAVKAAECLIAHSFAEDQPLAYFPPTYYLEPNHKDSYPHRVWEMNQGKTMFLEAVTPASAFLDLYELTGEERYKTQALHIADTYARLQNEDGSFPIKVDIATGLSVERAFCTPSTLLKFLRRLHNDYGIDDYEGVIARAEEWMNTQRLPSFDFTGQFEDSRIEGLKPYENLSQFISNEYADYLLAKDKLTSQELADVTDMVRFAEDQFVHWQEVPGKHGFPDELTPCVHEQYFFEVGIDDSAAGMSAAFLGLYLQTGDRLALAKALALADAITRAQNITSGLIPTSWQFNPKEVEYETFWPECSFNSASYLLRLDAVLNEINVNV